MGTKLLELVNNCDDKDQKRHLRKLVAWEEKVKKFIAEKINIIDCIPEIVSNWVGIEETKS